MAIHHPQNRLNSNEAATSSVYAGLTRPIWPVGAGLLSSQTVPERVTVVVPTKNSARTIGACCSSIVDQGDADLELIVVDDCSDDDTVAIAGQWADRVLDGGPGLAAQRNLGLWYASGEFVVFVDPDMVVECGVATEIVDSFRADARLGALVLPERSFGRGRWVGARVVEKKLGLGDHVGDLARAFRTVDVATAGGYNGTYPSQPRLGAHGSADGSLTERIVQAGWRLDQVETTVWRDEGDVAIGDLFRQKRSSGQNPKRCSPQQYRAEGSASVWQRGLRGAATMAALMANRPATAASLVMLKSVEAAGFVAGRLADRERCPA